MRSPARLRFLIPVCVALFAFICAAGPEAARAEAAASAAAASGTAKADATGLTAGEAHQLLSVLKDPARRAEFIATLTNLAKALPATGAAIPSPAPAKSAAAAKAPEQKVTLQPNSLGADLLTQADQVLQNIADNAAQSGAAIFDFRDLGNWLSGLPRNQATLAVVLSALWRLALVLGIGLLCDWGVRRLVRPVYERLGRESWSAERAADEQIAQSQEAVAEAVDHAVERARADGTAEAHPAAAPSAEGAAGTADESLPAQPTAPEREAEREAAASEAAAEAIAALSAEPAGGKLRPFNTGWPILRRLPFILGAMIVDAAPILVFMLVTNLLLASPVVRDDFVRLTVGAIVDAYILCRLLLVIARGTLSAPSPKLRLLHLSNDAAAFLARWSRRIAIVVMLGIAVTQIGAISGMTWALENALSRIFSLVIHLMLIIMVIKRRHEVAAWLQGDLDETSNGWRRIKVRLALVWHWQAIVIIALSWILFATQLTNQVSHPTRLVFTTLGFLIVIRVMHIVLLGALEKAFTVNRFDSDDRRALIVARAVRYHRPLHHLVNAAILLTAALGLMQIWGLPVFGWLASSYLGGRLVGSLMTITVTLAVAIVVWETLNFVLQCYIDDLTAQGAVMRAARLRTVLPLLRNTLLIGLLAVFVLTVLSEIGVNIGPLLAGASIFGVALGFGSQKLVQDFINGIFLLLENAMQVGDWVTAAGLSGAVEQMSIRTMRLRDGDGAVHIIPFSSVTTVTNTNRGMGNVTLSVSIAYDEDTDAAGQLLIDLVAQIRSEEAYAAGFLGEFSLWGVSAIDGRSATVTGRVSCTDSMRWPIERELNRRIKLTFQEKGFHLMPSGSVLALQHPLDVRLEQPHPSARAEARAPGQA